ncbi:MAG: TonB-dependent receptor plug domain-containing protein, partial [Thermodesulfobacteriota bacterium]
MMRASHSPGEVSAEGERVAAAPSEELLLFFEEKDLIVTATKQPQTLQRAPAVATVFTARDIRNMGARDIMDVLKRVPGIAISKSFYGPDTIEVRGILGFRAEQVKFLIDGVSINTLGGGAIWPHDSLSVDNVKRVEVIRGPGSALYGTDAFSAIVNIITK